MGLLGGVGIVAKEEVERDLKKEKKRAKKEAKKARKKEKKERRGREAAESSDSSGSDNEDDRGLGSRRTSRPYIRSRWTSIAAIATARGRARGLDGRRPGPRPG